MTALGLSAEDLEIQERARRFVDEELIPGRSTPRSTRDGSPTRRAKHHRLAKELGLFAMNMPKDLGGGGFTMLQQVLVSEQIGR